METRRMTNILLLLIFLALTAIVLLRLQPQEVSAETFKLDDTITVDPYQEPAAYLHVIVHQVSPIQAQGQLP
jgi:hypothetical protein|tara:strand:- start:750 stop:965 length:216 start_codon:yes stop_codon:yes gene_type:complete